MAKIKKEINNTAVDKKTHLGYNEKNPTQPQGAFKADSMETANEPIKDSTVKKKKPRKIAAPK